MSPAARWYAVIDGAQDPSLVGMVRQCAEHTCLISGALDETLAAALPWLVAFDPDAPLMQRWRAEGEGRAWGILLCTPLALRPLRARLKKVLNAILPDGTEVLFRFYDPVVLRTFLAAAQPDECAPFFDGIDRYWVESAVPGRYHDFQLRDGIVADLAAGGTETRP